MNNNISTKTASAVLITLVSLTTANAQFNKLKNAIKKTTEATKQQTAQPTNDNGGNNNPANPGDSAAKSGGSVFESERKDASPAMANKITWQKSVDLLPTNETDTSETSLGTRNLTVDASGTIYAGAERIYASKDAGKSWTMLAKGIHQGKFNPPVTSLAVSPKGVIYAGIQDIGVWTSADKGRTWKQANPDPGGGIPLFNEINCFAFDPKGIVYVGTATDGVFVSKDNHKTWQKSNAGLPISASARRINSLAVNAQGHVFLSLYDGSTYRSTDNSATWHDVGKKIVNPARQDLKVYSTALALNSQNHVFASSYYGLFRSTDNGETWKEVIGGEYLDDVQIAPDGKIYAFKKEGSRLFVSSDNGDNWTELNMPKVKVSDFLILPNNQVVAGTADSEGLFVYLGKIN